MQIHLFHFSPRGTSERAGRALAAGFGAPVVAHDMASVAFPGATVPAGDVAVFAGPVYGGRIPAAQAEAMRRVSGSGALAVPLAVYGNRAFEDALVEMADIAAGQGFSVAAAAAAIAQHAMFDALAAGRPTDADCAELSAFGARIAKKIACGQTAAPAIPGNRPYRAFAKAPVAVVNDPAKCLRCGACAMRCPVGAIPIGNPTQTDPALCILCGRCVASCPAGARTYPAPVTEGVRARLSPLLGVRKANELFL